MFSYINFNKIKKTLFKLKIIQKIKNQLIKKLLKIKKYNT